MFWPSHNNAQLAAVGLRMADPFDDAQLHTAGFFSHPAERTMKKIGNEKGKKLDGTSRSEFHFKLVSNHVHVNHELFSQTDLL
jgi:hypothetical protein